MTPEFVVDVLWVAWFASWMAAALWSDVAVTRPAVRSEIAYRLLAIAGAFLLFGFAPFIPDGERFLWHAQSWFGWAAVAVAACGFAFTWVARVYLGRLWSSTVTRKAEHHIVDGGPYRIVPHPIYAGVTLATIATAVVRGRTSALAGAALITLGWYVKARLEERFLREQLGRDAYDAYARRVPMLVPFTRPGGRWGRKPQKPSSWSR